MRILLFGGLFCFYGLCGVGSASALEISIPSVTTVNRPIQNISNTVNSNGRDSVIEVIRPEPINSQRSTSQGVVVSGDSTAPGFNPDPVAIDDTSQTNVSTVSLDNPAVNDEYIGEVSAPMSWGGEASDTTGSSEGALSSGDPVVANAGNNPGGNLSVNDVSAPTSVMNADMSVGSPQIDSNYSSDVPIASTTAVNTQDNNLLSGPYADSNALGGNDILGAASVNTNNKADAINIADFSARKNNIRNNTKNNKGGLANGNKQVPGSNGSAITIEKLAVDSGTGGRNKDVAGVEIGSSTVSGDSAYVEDKQDVPAPNSSVDSGTDHAGGYDLSALGGIVKKNNLEQDLRSTTNVKEARALTNKVNPWSYKYGYKRKQYNDRHDRVVQYHNKQIIHPAMYGVEYGSDNAHLAVIIQDRDYRGLLLSSIERDDTLLLSALIDRIGDVDVRLANGDTPLIFAVRCGNINAIRTLLVRGASIGDVDGRGIGTIAIAQQLQRSDIVSLLRSVVVIDN